MVTVGLLMQPMVWFWNQVLCISGLSGWEYSWMTGGLFLYPRHKQGKCHQAMRFPVTHAQETTKGARGNFDTCLACLLLPVPTPLV